MPSSKDGMRSHGSGEAEADGPIQGVDTTGPLWWVLTVCQTLWGTLYVISISYKADTFKSPICR